MKKIFICVLSVLLVCSLCACGNLKDTVLDGYDNLIQLFSKQVLTDDKDLVGERKYADDEYTGTYEADYEKFNGEEFLFGGTALEREDGNALKVTYTLKITEGTASLYRVASGEEYTITDEDSDDIYEFTISSGDNYIVLKGEDFTGALTIAVE